MPSSRILLLLSAFHGTLTLSEIILRVIALLISGATNQTSHLGSAF